MLRGTKWDGKKPGTGRFLCIDDDIDHVFGIIYTYIYIYRSSYIDSYLYNYIYIYYCLNMYIYIQIDS